MSDNELSRKSTRDKALVVAVIFVLGLLAALGWTNLQATGKAHSQYNAVMGNLRMLSQAAEQVFTDQGISSVAYTTLVGTNSSQYVRTFATVANETYPAVILQGTAITASGIAGARTITIGP
jgi:type IV pilus assembly protein PilA